LSLLDDLEVIPLNEQVEKKAIELRRSTKLKLLTALLPLLP